MTDDAWLDVFPGGAGPVRHALDRGRPVVVGRAKAADVALHDSAVNRTHARIAFVDGGWRLFDERSVNGTLLNGVGVEHDDGALLLDGDVITAGRSRVEFRAPRHAWGAEPVVGPTGRHALVALRQREPRAFTIVSDDDVGSAVLDDVSCVADGAPLARRALAPGLARVEDLEGAALRDLRRATADGAAFDPALAVAVARLVLAARIGEVDRGVRVTFAGRLVAYADVASLPPGDLERFAARTALALVGAPAPLAPPARAADEQREIVRAQGDLLFVPDARAPLRALADAAADAPHRVPAVLDEAQRALGAPTPAQLGSLVRGLFPEAAARHERVREELLVLGAGVVDAQRPR